MHAANKYSKLVFYIEACEAGSMFYGLLDENINVYATTATDHLVSSYACYYDSERGTYLGDEYSVAWMECKWFALLYLVFKRAMFQYLGQ